MSEHDLFVASSVGLLPTCDPVREAPPDWPDFSGATFSLYCTDRPRFHTPKPPLWHNRLFGPRRQPARIGCRDRVLGFYAVFYRQFGGFGATTHGLAPRFYPILFKACDVPFGLIVPLDAQAVWGTIVVNIPAPVAFGAAPMP
jgi:hypothetical protein